MLVALSCDGAKRIQHPIERLTLALRPGRAAAGGNHQVNATGAVMLDYPRGEVRRRQDRAGGTSLGVVGSALSVARAVLGPLVLDRADIALVEAKAPR